MDNVLVVTRVTRSRVELVGVAGNVPAARKLANEHLGASPNTLRWTHVRHTITNKVAFVDPAGAVRYHITRHEVHT
jgi:hypothetical protein